MKHKVKVVSAENDCITLKVDGQLLSYIISRPQPLRSADSYLWRMSLDERWLKSMFDLAVADYPNVFVRLVRWFKKTIPVRGYDTSHSEYCFYPNLQSQRSAVTDFLLKVGVEVDIDKETKVMVVLKTDIDKIREGNLI